MAAKIPFPMANDGSDKDLALACPQGNTISSLEYLPSHNGTPLGEDVVERPAKSLIVEPMLTTAKIMT